jgi:DNA-binding SARP family transcriptional activator
MQFGILGPLEVTTESGGPVAVGGARAGALLVVLLLHANESVSAERLAAVMWGDDAPPGAIKTVQVPTSRLRKALEDGAIVETTPGGYRLRVGLRELDAGRFDGLVGTDRQALADGEPELASLLLREARGLWRGPPLSDLAHEPFAAAEIRRPEEGRLARTERAIEGDLAVGRHGEVMGELAGARSLGARCRRSPDGGGSSRPSMCVDGGLLAFRRLLARLVVWHAGLAGLRRVGVCW